jgi:hypothetical protein
MFVQQWYITSKSALISIPQVAMYFTYSFGTVCASDSLLFSRGKVVIYVCEIAASSGTISVTKNECDISVE